MTPAAQTLRRRGVLLLILTEGIRCIRLFRKYKAEQQAELQAERDKIDAERAQAWIKSGAQPTDTVRALLKKVEVL